MFSGLPPWKQHFVKEGLTLPYCKVQAKYTFKGELNKYNVYLFIFNSIEDFELNQYQNFQLILPMHFSFYEVFCEQHHLQSVP